MTNESALRRAREALDKIANWTLPDTGKQWPDGDRISFGALYGSNGERDYMRNVASCALAALTAQAAPSEPVARYNCTTGGMEPDPQGEWIAFAAPPPPAAPAVAPPDAGNELLQRLIDSIDIVNGMACWDYAIMYDVRDALNAAPAVAVADLSPGEKPGRWSDDRWKLYRMGFEDAKRAMLAAPVQPAPQRQEDASDA
jgi:hypothetical protein